MTFNYLGSELTSTGSLQEEIKIQRNKATKIAGCLNDLILRQKYFKKESKVRIYKTIVRPILTYSSETKADTIITLQIL